MGAKVPPRRKKNDDSDIRSRGLGGAACWSRSPRNRVAKFSFFSRASSRFTDSGPPATAESSASGERAGARARGGKGRRLELWHHHHCYTHACTAAAVCCRQTAICSERTPFIFHFLILSDPVKGALFFFLTPHLAFMEAMHGTRVPTMVLVLVAGRLYLARPRSS